MANDRIYLVCKDCGDSVMLWKFYPFGGIISGGYMGDAEKLSDFLRKHLQDCHPRAYSLHLGDNPGFVLLTEEGMFSKGEKPTETKDGWNKQVAKGKKDK